MTSILLSINTRSDEKNKQQEFEEFNKKIQESFYLKDQQTSGNI